MTSQPYDANTTQVVELLRWKCADCDSWTWAETGPFGLPVIKRAHDETCPTWNAIAWKAGQDPNSVRHQLIQLRGAQ